jgi:F-type H+-transporting ATPase subunit a
MQISLPAEPVLHLSGYTVTNSMLSAVLISLFLIVIALLLRSQLRPVPGRLQSAVELIYSWLFQSAEAIIGRRDVTRAVFPYLITLFFFIVVSNWSGLLPGVGSIGVAGEHHGHPAVFPLFRAPTSDLNTVAALAVLTVIYIQYLGMRFAGPKIYLKKFFNFSDPIMFYVGILELISEFTRILSFSFRLFGNIFAGEVLVGVIFFLTTSLVPFVPFLPLPFFLLEMFVGVVQGFVFVFLTIVFTALAVASHEHDAHESEEAAKKWKHRKELEKEVRHLEPTILPTNH